MAINDGTISLIDFSQDDQYVIKKLLKTRNNKIKSILKILKNKKLPLAKEVEIVNKKFRYVDPEFLAKGDVNKLSKVDLKFKKFIVQQELSNQKGIKVPLAF